MDLRQGSLPDLVSPKGLAVNQDRDLVVAQGAFSDPASERRRPPVLVFDIHGREQGHRHTGDRPDQSATSRSALRIERVGDHTDRDLLHQLEARSSPPTFLRQATDPDPARRDPEPNPTESTRTA
jgi:hypothetical protein